MSSAFGIEWETRISVMRIPRSVEETGMRGKCFADTTTRAGCIRHWIIGRQLRKHRPKDPPSRSARAHAIASIPLVQNGRQVKFWVSLHGLQELVVAIDRSVGLKHVEDEALVNGLLHRVAVERAMLAWSVFSPPNSCHLR